MYSEWVDQLRALSLDPMHLVAANNQYDREYLWYVALWARSALDSLAGSVIAPTARTRHGTVWLCPHRAGTTRASEPCYCRQCANTSKPHTGRDDKPFFGAHITRRALDTLAGVNSPLRSAAAARCADGCVDRLRVFAAFSFGARHLLDQLRDENLRTSDVREPLLIEALSELYADYTCAPHCSDRPLYVSVRATKRAESDDLTACCGGRILWGGWVVIACARWLTLVRFGESLARVSCALQRLQLR